MRCVAALISTVVVLVGLCRASVAASPPDVVARDADLVIKPHGIHLTSQPPWTDFPREKAADRQNVCGLVMNLGKAPAKDVSVQLYTAEKGARPSSVGAPIAVDTIDDSRNKTIDAVWDLQGRNVEGVTLPGKVYTKSGTDANPKDDLASITGHIGYASNGKRAFRAYDDTYRFVNFGCNDRDFVDARGRPRHHGERHGYPRCRAQGPRTLGLLRGLRPARDVPAGEQGLGVRGTLRRPVGHCRALLRRSDLEAGRAVEGFALTRVVRYTPLGNTIEPSGEPEI